MTVAEMKALGERARHIEALQSALAKARFDLRLINEHGKRGHSWRVPIRLKDADRYGNGNTDITITVPFGVVQQQAVDEVRRVEREIIKLGGMPA